MKVKSRIMENMHLDPGYALLSIQNILTCLEVFRMLDIHQTASQNDVQFWVFVHAFTDLSKYHGELLFRLLDVDHSGEMDFDEFYLLFCIMIASKDQYEKEFIFRHSSSIFRLIDSDASGLVSSDEFSQMGILFNFNLKSISSIFDEFDVSGDKNLDFGEFRLFTMACIDEQRAADAHSNVTAFSSYHQRLLTSLQRILNKYMRTRVLPKPLDVEAAVIRVRPPYIPKKKKWKAKHCCRCCTAFFKWIGNGIRKFCNALKAACFCKCCTVCCQLCCKCPSKKVEPKPKRKVKKTKYAKKENYRNYYQRKRHVGLSRKQMEKEGYDKGGVEMFHHVPSEIYGTSDEGKAEMEAKAEYALTQSQSHNNKEKTRAALQKLFPNANKGGMGNRQDSQASVKSKSTK